MVSEMNWTYKKLPKKYYGFLDILDISTIVNPWSTIYNQSIVFSTMVYFICCYHEYLKKKKKP